MQITAKSGALFLANGKYTTKHLYIPGEICILYADGFNPALYSCLANLILFASFRMFE